MIDGKQVWVLGLETGGEHLSAALLRCDNPRAQAELGQPVDGRRAEPVTSTGGVATERGHLIGEVVAHRGSKHHDLMLGLVSELLTRHEVTVDQLALIAVTRGPGGFTGVRLGLSIAQGLAIASGVPIWPVSSLAALAMNAVVPGTQVLALLDAKKGEVYAAAYRLQAGRAPQTLLAPYAATCDSALAAAREAVGTDVVVLGSGALAYGVASPLRADAHVTSAAAVAELAMYEWAAAGYDATVTPPVDPTYLRKSEAEVAADLREAQAKG